MRITKNINGVNTRYTYNGDLLVCETNGTDTIWYTYDENGSPVGIKLNGTQYYYIKNVQGDIIGIVDISGNKVVEYTYNAWGYLRYTTGSLADTLGVKNHLRYRGYYYDVETGLYYLQSRYYDPQTGRFINADDTDYIGADGSFVSYNLFTYRGNNPIMNSDPSGCFGTPIQWVFAAVGGIVGWHIGDYVAKSFGCRSGWKYWTIRGGVAVGGAVLGWFAGTQLLKVLTKYLLANPSIASKLPRIALWFLGMGGTNGQIANQVFAKNSSHIFTSKHGLDSLISKFGERGVFNKAFQIVSSKITQAQNGSNQIYTTINGTKVTIRFWFKDGKFGSFNIIKGHVSRIIGKLLK